MRWVYNSAGAAARFGIPAQDGRGCGGGERMSGGGRGDYAAGERDGVDGRESGGGARRADQRGADEACAGGGFAESLGAGGGGLPEFGAFGCGGGIAIPLCAGSEQSA